MLIEITQLMKKNWMEPMLTKLTQLPKKDYRSFLLTMFMWLTQEDCFSNSICQVGLAKEEFSCVCLIEVFSWF